MKKVAISFAAGCAATVVVLVLACFSTSDLLTCKETLIWSLIITPIASVVTYVSIKRTGLIA